MSTKTDYMTVRQFATRHPAFSEPSLRSLIFHAVVRKGGDGEIPSNGFGAVMVRVGKRVLIDEEAFFTWLDSHREA